MLTVIALAFAALLAFGVLLIARRLPAPELTRILIRLVGVATAHVSAAAVIARG